MLRSAPGSPHRTLEKPDEFDAALRKAMSDAQDIEVLFAIWKHNVDTVRAINRRFKNNSAYAAVAQSLVAHLKACATNLTKPNDHEANLPVCKIS